MNPSCLAKIRFLAGYSQAELARRSGLSQGHISELERGEKQARPATIKKLALALGVPIPSLLDCCEQHVRGAS
jgi:transcriptional regulator with XRE-family HTH domain